MSSTPGFPSAGSHGFKAIALAGLLGVILATAFPFATGWLAVAMQGVALIVYALAWGEGPRAERLGMGVVLGCAGAWGLALARAAPHVLTQDALLDPEKAAPWIVIPALVAGAAATAAAPPSVLAAAGLGAGKNRTLARVPAALVTLAAAATTVASGWWAAGAIIVLAAGGGAAVGRLHGTRLAAVTAEVWRGGPSERRVVLAFLSLALALRVAAVLVVDMGLRDRPEYRPGPDGVVFHEAAKRIASGRIGILRDTEPVLWTYNPGPTLFYAAWYALLGDGYLPVGLAQALLGAGGCWFTWRLARLAGGPAAGIIALFLVAGRGYLVTHQAYLGAEAVAFFLIPFAAWALAEAAGNVRIKPAMLAGLAFGMATLFRPEFLAFPAVAGAWLAAHRKPRHLLLAIVLVSAAGLPTGLWIVRNANVHGQRSLQGNPENLAMPRSQALGLFPAAPFGEGRFGEVVRTTAQAFARDPLRGSQALWLDAGEKLVELFDFTRYTQRPLLVYVTVSTEVPRAVGAVLFLLTGAGAIAGLRAGIRHPAALCILIVAYKAVLHIPLKLAPWYRVTMEPFLMVLVGIGTMTLLTGAFRRHTTRSDQ